jgi:hypothetical protein
MVLGAIVGITTPMSNATVGAMCGFGAGALISALSIELVSSHGRGIGACRGGRSGPRNSPLCHSADCFDWGGLIFITLDQLLSAHGGYLRKGAYVIAQHARNKSKRQADLMQSIGNSSFSAACRQR